MENTMKYGKLAIVASTGGLKLEEEDGWINPADELKDNLDIEGLKKKKGEYIRLILKDGKYIDFLFTIGQDKIISKKQNTPMAPKTITLKGKQFVTHQGLLDEAHKNGLTQIITEMLSNSNFPSESAIFKATVIMSDEKGTVRSFSAHGDADKSNTGETTKNAIIRMAETRAINRALRLATNIGMTSVDELNETAKKIPDAEEEIIY